MTTRKIRIGSRDSKLAVIQTQFIMEQIRKHHPEIALELVTMKTTGDLILDQTLDKIGGKGLFVKELDQALQEERIDLSVHSMKDMPAQLPKELPILAVSRREDPRDVLILPQGADQLSREKAIGCSSARRRVQLLDLLPGLDVEPVRGNVLTRLRKLDEGGFSALVLAYAGLLRLRLEARVSKVFTTSEMIPAAGQGILAVQGRRGEHYEFLKYVHDLEAETAAAAEREFIRTLDGGCSSPVAAYAELHGTELRISGLYVDPVTGSIAKGVLAGDRSKAQKLGQELAIRLRTEVK